MTIERIYQRSLDQADEAFNTFKNTCARIRDGKDTEMQANTTLNSLISLCWQLKNAAMEREPAPLPPKPTAAKKKGGTTQTT